MSYETYTRAMRILRSIAGHIRAERGTGNCADAIARNRTLRTLADAEFTLTGEYARNIFKEAE